MEIKNDTLSEQIVSTGCAFVRNFFSADEIRTIRYEIEEWEKKDLEERKLAGIEFGRFAGSAGVTHYNQGRHIITDFFSLSPTLDSAVGRLLDDARVAQLLEFMGGKNIKLRGYNTRHMTGNKEYSAMEWHRDNVGEITIGLLLDDSNESIDGATCYIPASHLYPYCPLQKANFKMPYPILSLPLWQRFFSYLLEKRTTSKTTHAIGNAGDVYFFPSDLWHGRQANLHESKGMVFFIGLFPSEIPFPSHSEVNIPSKEILERLPASLKKIVDYTNLPKNTDQSAYYYQLQNFKITFGTFSLWNLAVKEREFWESKRGKSLIETFKNLNNIGTIFLEQTKRVIRFIKRRAHL